MPCSFKGKKGSRKGGSIKCFDSLQRPVKEYEFLGVWCICKTDTDADLILWESCPYLLVNTQYSSGRVYGDRGGVG